MEKSKNYLKNGKAHHEINDGIENLQDFAGEMVERAKTTGADTVEKSVEFAKKYPVHSALGAGALGLVAGYLIGKLK